MGKKKTPSNRTAPVILNRRARYDYELGDELETGVVLTGPEVRAARDGHVQLRGAFVTIREGELWLNNASFSLSLNERGHAASRAIDTRPRKLLAHRKQIERLSELRTVGRSIVPLRLVTGGKRLKLVIAIGKGKKSYDKRETIKRRQQDRDTRRELAKY